MKIIARTLSLPRLLICLITLAGATPSPALADKNFTNLSEKFRKNSVSAFRKLARQSDPDSVYAPLISYWGSVLDLRDRRPQTMEKYLKESPSLYLREEAREHLLKHYARTGDWPAFSAHAAQGPTCATLLSDAVNGNPDLEKLRRHWWQDRRHDDDICLHLYRLALRKNWLQKDDIWKKIRQLAGSRSLSPTRRLLSAFPGYLSYSSVRRVVLRATGHIRAKHGLNTRPSRELVMIAAMAAVQKSPTTAISRWQKFSRYFSADENDHVHTVLAEWAARWHRQDAVTLYRKTSGRYATDNTRAWRLRDALRRNDFATVIAVHETMSDEEQSISAWRYWFAIALQKTGQQPQTATRHLRTLAEEEDDFYGLLARDTLGMPPPKPAATDPVPPGTALEVDFALALFLHRVGHTETARRIWRHTARHPATSTEALLAATTAAAEADWHLAAIESANQIKNGAAHALRFPLPYDDAILKYSRRFSLDPAFVYGLIRQESRFMPKIVSSANAQGLMQVIPRTALLVARKHRYTKYRLSRLKRVDTNVIIGTTYLSDLAKRLGTKPAFIAAAYNAGPTRVPRWRKASTDPLIAIENIPITETRLYVKYVLANRLHYAARLGAPYASMSEAIRRPMTR